MTPGPTKADRPQGQWYLCVRCWADGIKTKAAPFGDPVPVSPEMADALRKSSWKVADYNGEPVKKPRRRKSG